MAREDVERHQAALSRGSICTAIQLRRVIAIAEYSAFSIRDTIIRLRNAGLDSIPGGGAEILDDEVRYKIARINA